MTQATNTLQAKRETQSMGHFATVMLTAHTAHLLGLGSARGSFITVTCIAWSTAFLLSGPLPAADSEDLAGRVAMALQAEAEGDFLARQRLLAEAGEHPTAKWHSGQLLQDGNWHSVLSSVKHASQDPMLAQYEQRRARATDDVASHFVLATWCARQELWEQSRAHLNRVLAFEPDNQAARMALGYRMIDGRWISPAEIVQLQQRTQFAIDSMRQYATRVQKIRRGMESKHSHIRESAVANLKSIQVSEAVPCVESIFASSDAEATEHIVHWLAAIDSVDASQSLARFSLFHTDPRVRESATRHLAERNLHDFVPELLKMLEGPVAMMLVPGFDANGNLNGYRYAFSKEQIDRTEVLLLDRVFQRNNVRLESLEPGPTGQVDVTLNLNRQQELALREFAAGEWLARSAAVRSENALTSVRNARIADVLSAVAGKEFSVDPQPLWDWWDEYCETDYQSDKPQRYRRESLVSRVPRYTAVAATPFVGECFVAGTMVVTQRGPKAIESMAVGDMVLSRDLALGELTWKPVLRATTRRPEKTLRVQTDGESWACTPGHLFWVSGRGWQKASQLRVGDVLHAADEPAIVMSATAGEMRETFNLEVADNANYFIGNQMILTHDVTPPRPGRDRVPGQAYLAALVAAD
jgi:hypothetical protein